MGSIEVRNPLLSKKLKRTETRLLIIDDNQIRFNKICDLLTTSEHQLHAFLLDDLQTFEKQLQLNWDIVIFGRAYDLKYEQALSLIRLSKQPELPLILLKPDDYEPNQYVTYIRKGVYEVANLDFPDRFYLSLLRALSFSRLNQGQQHLMQELENVQTQAQAWVSESNKAVAADNREFILMALLLANGIGLLLSLGVFYTWYRNASRVAQLNSALAAANAATIGLAFNLPLYTGQATQNRMPPSEFIVLICGDDCSASRSDGSEPGPSVLCDTPHPKRKAIVVDWSVLAASGAVASSVPAKFSPKCGPVGATPPSGLVLDIIGIAAGERGCRCEDNMVCCGDLLEEDSVVQRATLLA